MDDLLELTSRAEATHFWFHGFRAFVAPVIADLAAGRTDLQMVDCGCGTGHNLALLEPYGHVYGFDLTPGGLAYARATGHPVVRADVTRVPFASERFDLATSFDVLQSIEAADVAMREMARIVRPGGAVVATVAALEALRGDHSEAWQEVRRFTRPTLTALAERAGLRVEHLSYHFLSLLPLMFAVRLVQRATRSFRAHRADSDIAVPAAPVNLALTGLVKAEAAFARRVPLPLGSSLLMVARKG